MLIGEIMSSTSLSIFVYLFPVMKRERAQHTHTTHARTDTRAHVQHNKYTQHHMNIHSALRGSNVCISVQLERVSLVVSYTPKPTNCACELSRSSKRLQGPTTIDS